MRNQKSVELFEILVKITPHHFAYRISLLVLCSKDHSKSSLKEGDSSPNTLDMNCFVKRVVFAVELDQQILKEIVISNRPALNYRHRFLTKLVQDISFLRNH